jgi:anti-sigma regulatory factor (Ser/Thr protein kinase)
VATKAHDGYRHEALFYRDDAEYLQGTVGFVADAVALGQPVMVAVPGQRLEALRAELDGAADALHIVDMTRMGHNPARIIPAWRAFLDRHGAAGQAVRGIGEPVWHGRRAPEVDECHLHEALLNVAVDPDAPFWLRCPYDVEALGEAATEAAQRNHATYVSDGDLVGSRTYGGLDQVEALFRADLEEPDGPAELMDFGEGDLVRVRQSVTHHAREAGLDADRTSDLVLAITELATNSLRHGGGRGWLRTWRDADALVYEVRDTGRIHDPLVGRRAPQPSDEGGRGVWMANQLCDLVQVRSGDDGTVVRTRTWL